MQVARRHNIAREDIGVVEFGSFTGAALAKMSDRQFAEINATFGSLLYAELRSVLLQGERENVGDGTTMTTSIADDSLGNIDDLIRYCKDVRDVDDEAHAQLAQPSTSRGNFVADALNASSLAAAAVAQQQQLSVGPPPIAVTGQFLFGAASPLNSLAAAVAQPPTSQTLGAPTAAALAALHNSPLHQPMAYEPHASLQQLFAARAPLQPPPLLHSSALSPASLEQKPHDVHRLQLAAQQPHFGPLRPPPPLVVGYEAAGRRDESRVRRSYARIVAAVEKFAPADAAALAGAKVRKNKDGRPRKRSQHTKG